MAQNFSRFRVLDMTGELGPYAAKMFAGLGADVIHVEPPAGDPLRRVGPFFHGDPGVQASLPYLYYNAGKRGLALDLEHEAGREVFRRLCRGADLLIESCRPGWLDGSGLSWEALSKDNARLVQTSITPFGRTGPLAAYPGSDLTCSALSGFLYLAGVNGDKPVRAPDNQAYRMAEAYAAVGSAIALFSAQRTGRGQIVDVACIEAEAMALENAAQFWDLEGKIRRGRGREAGSATLHPCADGYIALVAIMGRNKEMWTPFVRWMEAEGVEEWQVFDDDRWIDYAYRTSEAGYATFCRVFERYTLTRSKAYLYETGQRFNVAVTPVSDGQDLLANPQLMHRNFWQTQFNDTLGADISYPGAPYEFGELAWQLGRNAPRIGEHTREILIECGYSAFEIDKLVRVGAVYAEQH
ncbi:CoA transferase [Azoarcus sp. DN11]|uniref:CaiB/BaiF CoA transferase family protein n=1 Tax=Azoarcus sp. DN11 TaxID=356837 RepID=UPI000EB2BFE5|nr:CoA transferase [Azoarcus sp. DN11]AYH43220.1 benzylsuccinate CoA-transferase [Azoarcus sp. DN11]